MGFFLSVTTQVHAPFSGILPIKMIIHRFQYFIYSSESLSLDGHLMEKKCTPSDKKYQKLDYSGVKNGQTKEDKKRSISMSRVTQTQCHSWDAINNLFIKALKNFTVFML